MSLGEHLVELRKRLFIIAAGIVVAMIGGVVVSEWAIEMMAAPITAIADERGQALLNFDAVTGAFDLRMKVALTIGIVISSPIWLYQIWAFLVPGLTRKEIGYALGFLLSAVPLFLAGCAAGWLVMPHIVELMVGFTPADASNFFNAGIYFDFVLKLRTEVFSLLLDVVADGPCWEKRRVGLIWSGLRLVWRRDGGGEEVVEGGEDGWHVGCSNLDVSYGS